MVRSIDPNLINEHLGLLLKRDAYRVIQFLQWNRGEAITSKRILFYLQERRNRGLFLSTIKSDKNSILRGIRKSIIGQETYRGFIDELRQELNEALPIRLNATRVSEADLVTMDEMKRICRLSPPRWKALAEFFWTTGARVGDLSSIKLRDCRPLIEPSGEEILVEIKIVGKGNRTRFIAIPTELYQEIRHAFGGMVYLFETEWHNQMTTSKIGKIISKIGIKYLGRRIYPHLFRHTWITAQVKAGWDIGAIAEFAGNSPEIIARVYLHSSLDRKVISDYYKQLKVA
ncbi:tyrosine-type recombinase/integrase [Leptospira ilyithenensis]|uniref:Site-specific integrase n=1 Tax=Leptospira ilyithenensis TaxID=2484901 RepID=A0A4R9LMJ3_9LEPT|nr:site-specific integrase [Leptospira ilyithenensis]TGN09781.1 site-specific integrase [Leptospira ilyithenensis]